MHTIKFHLLGDKMSLLDLSALKRAIDAFSRTCHAVTDQSKISQLSPDLQDALKAGVIQNFEFSYEIAWKFIKRWLEKNYSSSYVDGITRRELFRLAAESHLIDNVETWMTYHQARNQTSHTYDQKIALEVYHISLSFLDVVETLYQQLQKKNDE